MENRAPPSNNIAATIFRDLRSQILKGTLKPAERLPGERELSAKYGTNRNTLREAVRMLEQARLVTVRHGQGVTVCDFRKTGTMELLPPFLEAAGNAAEIAALLEDILPARLLVLEFATKLAAKRASPDDIARLRDITELLIAAFERRDPVVIAHGFQRWLDELLDAGHSVAVRWIANPFLDAYRELLDRFPALWILEPSFPQHLRDVVTMLEKSDEEGALAATRNYYHRVDDMLMKALGSLMGAPLPR
ncbi:MAG TPA: GntR family transcriptional regulator [Polyangiaceae bacterium]|jgi:GntR family transcriptional repressor for pyruvate dehydrogenase complex